LIWIKPFAAKLVVITLGDSQHLNRGSVMEPAPCNLCSRKSVLVAEKVAPHSHTLLFVLAVLAIVPLAALLSQRGPRLTRRELFTFDFSTGAEHVARWEAPRNCDPDRSGDCQARTLIQINGPSTELQFQW
jgi:hypothetical protein